MEKKLQQKQCILSQFSASVQLSLSVLTAIFPVEPWLVNFIEAKGDGSEVK